MLMLSQIICTSCKAFRANEINVDVLQKSSYRISYIKQWSDVDLIRSTNQSDHIVFTFKVQPFHVIMHP